MLIKFHKLFIILFIAAILFFVTPVSLTPVSSVAYAYDSEKTHSDGHKDDRRDRIRGDRAQHRHRYQKHDHQPPGITSDELKRDHPIGKPAVEPADRHGVGDHKSAQQKEDHPVPHGGKSPGNR